MQRAPQAPALVHGAVSYTYEELLRASSAVAQQLVAQGVAPGTLVPVSCRGGVALPVAVIGILLAGAAFVPLDADWPTERMTAVLTKLAPPVLLYEDGTDTALFEGLAIPHLPVNLDGLEVMNPPGTGPEDLCYGFFTSGSTGTPKCCLNTHEGVLNRFAYMSAYFGLKPGEAVMQNSHHVFDSSLWQLLWPLTVGAKVVIPDRDGILDIEGTLRDIHAHKVVMTDFVPSILNIVLRSIDAAPDRAGQLSSMKNLIVGGEEVSHAAICQIRKMVPGLRVTNTYGPTECAIGMCFHDITEADDANVPIGLPIANTHAVILDDALRPVAPGSVGQIAISGRCLGRGYFDEPEKTAAVFVPNRFDEIPHKRLYLTGDLGHIGPDGALRFDGRNDFQIKIGGVRIELGEVTTRVLDLPEVTECVILPQSRGNGLTSLTAVLCVAAPIDGVRIKDHLAQHLTKACIPTTYHVIDAMPLTPNGKIDRKALQARLDVLPAASDGAEARGDRTVATLIEIWNAELDRRDCGPDTNFFEAGGDSLSAVNLVLGIAERLERDASIEDLMRAPTPAALARLLAEPDHPDAPSRDLDQKLLGLVESDLAEARALIARTGLPHGPAAGKPQSAFVTGATGFVGAHLVDALIDRGFDPITCLVRGDDPAVARLRLQSVFASYGLDPDRLEGRITCVAGQLGEKRFGLDPAAFDHLAKATDVILHAGAEVNMAKPYDALRHANVQGTINVLALSGAGQGVPIHYVSTLSVLPTAPLRSGEAQAPSLIDALRGSGYDCSKSVAELMLLEARNAGVPVSIFRVGEALPATDTGAYNRNSTMHQMIEAALRLRMRPDVHLSVDCSPVDTLSDAIAEAMLLHATASRTYHLFNPQTLGIPELLGLVRDKGMALRDVPYAEFHAALRALCDRRPCAAKLRGLLGQLPAPKVAEADTTALSAFEDRFPDPALHYIETAGDRLGINWPRPELLATRLSQKGCGCALRAAG
ncbi:non-ribosomal peptide synthetase [Thalassococcus sp. BH17M4-6]|uniref:non-ribosomal peptide synthetase n=1 Tax=Thalassococcus sp. BH17M4-6 TaxID=3413148 RepID=UPI003BCED04B